MAWDCSILPSRGKNPIPLPRKRVHVPDRFSFLGDQRVLMARFIRSSTSRELCAPRRSRLLVYTRPDTIRAETNLSVLYMLHGFSDDASDLVGGAAANVILDNLIAQGSSPNP